MLSLAGFLGWLRQPTTVTGLSAAAAAAAGVLSGQMNAASVVPMLAFSAVAMLLPDNTAAQKDAGKLAVDALAVLRGGAAPAQVAPVVQDVVAVMDDLRARTGESPAKPEAPYG
jgi:hypothetical protein